MKRYPLWILIALIGVLEPPTAWAQTNAFVYDANSGVSAPLVVDTSLSSLEGQYPLDYDPEDTMVAASVIDGEDWRQVSNRNPKFSPAVYIVMEGEGVCSGAMVGRAAVLTAAHCVYSNPAHTTKLISAKTITAYVGGISSGLRAKGKNIYVLNGSKNHSTDDEEFSKFDYAIIILDSPVGDKSGYYGARILDFTPGNHIEILSFPGTKDASNPWLSTGKVTKVKDGIIYHTADTAGGSSGAPVFIDSPASIRAVHIGGGKTYNMATTSVNHRLISFIEQYRGYR